MDPSGLTEDMKDDIWIRDEYSCRFCSDTIARHELTVTFLVPPDEGGSRSSDNIVSKCPRCVREGVRKPITGREERSVFNLMRDLRSGEEEEEELELDRDLEDEISALDQQVVALTGEVRSLMEELDKKTSLAIAYRKKLERSQRDYDNLKRRLDSDVEMRVKEGLKGLVEGAIETVDNLERGIAEAGKMRGDVEMAPVAGGMEVILKGLMHTLEKNGVIRIDPIGKKFDPRSHEALKTVEEPRAFENTVVEVEVAGYILDDMLIRPAKVIISRGGEKWPKGVSEVRRSTEDHWGGLVRDLEVEVDWEEEEAGPDGEEEFEEEWEV